MVHMWNLLEGKHVHSMAGHEDDVTSVVAGNFKSLAAVGGLDEAATLGPAPHKVIDPHILQPMRPPFTVNRPPTLSQYENFPPIFTHTLAH